MENLGTKHLCVRTDINGIKKFPLTSSPISNNYSKMKIKISSGSAKKYAYLAQKYTISRSTNNTSINDMVFKGRRTSSVFSYSISFKTGKYLDSMYKTDHYSRKGTYNNTTLVSNQLEILDEWHGLSVSESLLSLFNKNNSVSFSTTITSGGYFTGIGSKSFLGSFRVTENDTQTNSYTDKQGYYTISTNNSLHTSENCCLLYESYTMKSFVSYSKKGNNSITSYESYDYSRSYKYNTHFKTVPLPLTLRFYGMDNINIISSYNRYVFNTTFSEYTSSTTTANGTRSVSSTTHNANL